MLDISLNFQNEELPSHMTLQNRNLRALFIANSQLRGSIPERLSGSSNLQLLDLSQNHLGESVPHWMGSSNLSITCTCQVH